MSYRFLLGLMSVALLAACNSDREQSLQVPPLNTMQPALSPLSAANTTQFSIYLKNGIYQRAQGGWNEAAMQTLLNGISPDMQYSRTTSQEQTVAEANRVQYDGQYLYVAASPWHDLEAHQSSTQTNYLRVLTADADGLLTEVKQLPLGDAEQPLTSLYHHQQTLVAISQSQQFSILPFAFARFAGSDHFTVDLLDVSVPAQTSKINTLHIDGNLIDSRVIGDQLYLVSHYYPQVQNLNNGDDDAARLANYTTIVNTKLTELLPKINDTRHATSQPLIQGDSCLVPKDATTLDGYDGITTITRIALSDSDNRTTLCINSALDGIYVNESHLYAFSTRYDSQVKTAVHKFALTDEDINYAATGVFNGRLQSYYPNLRFSAKGGQLRIVMSEDLSAGHYRHTLYVTEQQGNNLAVIGQYPNTAQDTPIGKTDDSGQVSEDIYAVRYVDERAYIVTFERVDPLYVLDLSSSTAPNLVGSLEVSGYSAYLQPLDNHLLLGIGQQTDIQQDPQGNPRIVSTGTKVSLFNVADLNNPQLIAAEVIAGAYSPVEFDYHALSWLAMPDQYRLALPVERWLTDSNEIWQRQNQMLAFNVSKGTSPQLTYNGSSEVHYAPLPAPDFVDASRDRAVLNSTMLYYVHGNYVWQSPWQTPAMNSGPR
ncbi:beta-propeller domain-containing protein [Pseudoalteromonas fenneropenaei]|uniref:Beta-propeller domain-containing protein n=1 Tax=Pseudoalteromonas fenneropenaei TaxID=1737459 RepID=A0ABV7CK61_9GAMM